MIPDLHLQKFVIPGSGIGLEVPLHSGPTTYPSDHTLHEVPRCSGPTNYSSGQTLHEVFWRTILTDRWISENGEVCRLSLDSNGIPSNILPRFGRLEWIAERRLQNDLLCMKSSISADGRSLMVPWDSEAGDIIVVLSGGKVPYVLRKDEGLEGEYYKLVGEWYVISTFVQHSLTFINHNPSYVHGMMDGEALRGSGQNFQKFHLI
jgi:hypothetical protein